MSRRVAVIGGGLAGISAALACADRGAQVVLFERRQRLGGLTWSFRRNGAWFDNGQHVFLRCCSAYRSFIERIGASDQVLLQPRLDIPVLAPSGATASITRTALPAPLHLALALGRYGHLSRRERAGLGRAVWALRRLEPADVRLDEVSFGEWLSGHGQSDRAIAHLWDLVTLPTLNVPAAQASLALAAKVFRTGLLDRADGGDVGWSLVPLGRLHGENAARALEAAGVEVVLGAKATSIERCSDGGFAVRSATTAAPSPPVAGKRADAVIVATPPNVAAALAPAGALAPTDGLGVSPIVNVHLVLDRRVTDLAMAACVDSPVQFVFDRTESAGLARPQQYLAISLSAADVYLGRGSSELVRSMHEALGEVFPGARRARLVDAVVTREPEATFRATPGSARFRARAVTPVPGLLLAGAWCQTGWPATMEGAVRSGHEAAVAALDPRSGLERVHPPVLEEAAI